MPTEQNRRISNAAAAAMIAVALLFDSAQGVAFLLNGIPGVGQVLDVALSWLITAVAWITFLLWFALKRVSYFDKNAGKKFLTLIGSIVAELIPFINTLPATTLGVSLLIAQTRTEDRERAAVAAANDNAPQERQEAA